MHHQIQSVQIRIGFAMDFLKKICCHQLVLFACVVTVYLAAPVVQMLDSKYTLVVSQNLIERQTFKLDHYFSGVDDFNTIKLPHGMVVANSHVYYFFPDGPSLLSVPYVAFMRQFGIQPVDQGLHWNPDVEARMQRGLAALLTAGIVTAIYGMARYYLTSWISWIVALTFAFGTSLLSSASRGVWSLTWGTFLLSLALWLLVRAERTGRLSPVLLATVLSWAYFSKPTFSTSILAVTVYMLLHHRDRLLQYVLTGTCWGLAFLGYSFYNFGKPLPIYYSLPLFAGESGFWEGLAGALLSPSRGLFVYSPFLVLVLWLLVRHCKIIASPRLAALSGVVFIFHAVVIGASPNWWGGHCYGPRLMTDALPWLALLAILALEARQRVNVSSAGSITAQGSLRQNVMFAALMLPLIAFSLFVNYRGAFSHEVHNWNTQPDYINYNSPRMWDWCDAQFLKGLK
jgi:hypothetical protein